MKDERLRELLQRTRVPDELGAERRAYDLVRRAFGERDPAVRRRSLVRPALVFAAVVALAAAALGGAWMRDVVARDAEMEQPRPAALSLPTGGRLLVESERGAWVVQRDGSARFLGRYDSASWSPRGLYAVVTRENGLLAVTPSGDPRWSLSRRRVADARWAPSGYRVSYRSGSSLRVVVGNGERDRLVARRVAAVAAEWRPGARHVLAYVDGRGRINVVDTDRLRPLALRRPEPGGSARQLAWSADGSLLALRTSRDVQIYSMRTPNGSLPEAALERVHTGRFGPLAFAPSGRRFAAARGGAVVTVDADTGRGRVLLRGLGAFGEVAWSPNGRWLLAAWPVADRWLFLRLPGPRNIDAASGITREFDPGGEPGGPFPRVAGWCCPR